MKPAPNNHLVKNSGNTSNLGKKDSMGISPLKNESGEEVIDSKGKAEILNQQYDRVFTDEDLSTIPEQETNVAPDIERLHIITNGVCMLLKKA